jgi:hypothetical protein
LARGGEMEDGPRGWEHERAEAQERGGGLGEELAAGLVAHLAHARAKARALLASQEAALERSRRKEHLRRQLRRAREAEAALRGEDAARAAREAGADAQEWMGSVAELLRERARARRRALSAAAGAAAGAKRRRSEGGAAAASSGLLGSSDEEDGESASESESEAPPGAGAGAAQLSLRRALLADGDLSALMLDGALDSSQRRQLVDKILAYRLAGMSLFRTQAVRAVSRRVGLRFDTSYRGRYLERYYAVLAPPEPQAERSGFDALVLVRHTLPHFVPAEQLFHASDLRGFVREVDARLHAFVTRREQAAAAAEALRQAPGAGSVRLDASVPYDRVQFVGEHGREIVVVFTSLMDTAPRTLTLVDGQERQEIALTEAPPPDDLATLVMPHCSFLLPRDKPGNKRDKRRG